MTKFISPLHKTEKHSSVVWHDSKIIAGVRYATRRISLLQRIELTSQVRELMLRHEFLKAGDAAEGLEATLGELFVQKLYVEWGLCEIDGLTIDGEPASRQLLIEKGPESLTQEIVAAIRSELELSEQERKNF